MTDMHSKREDMKKQKETDLEQCRTFLKVCKFPNIFRKTAYPGNIESLSTALQNSRILGGLVDSSSHQEI